MSGTIKRPVPAGSVSAQDEADADDGPCSSSSPPDAKRARYSSASAEQAGSRAQQQQQLPACEPAVSQAGRLCLQVPRFRHTQHVVRPGVPHPIDLAHFKLPDKPSPPVRDDDKVWRRGTRDRSQCSQQPAFGPQHHPTCVCCACRRGTITTSSGRTSALDVSAGSKPSAQGQCRGAVQAQQCMQLRRSRAWRAAEAHSPRSASAHTAMAQCYSAQWHTGWPALARHTPVPESHA